MNAFLNTIIKRLVKLGISATLLVLVLGAWGMPLVGQSLTGQQLLTKTIQFHDPGSKWVSADIHLDLKGERPDGSSSMTQVTIDLMNSFFSSERDREGKKVRTGIQGDSCFASIDGRTELTEEEIKSNRADCATIQRMRDYYIYLYGLPMKLRDPGTIIDDKVDRTTFNGKEYLVLKVGYEEEVGQHTWLFFIHPETYAMEGYQFYKDEKTKEGEYIYLDGLKDIGGMKLPAIRKWYYVPGDKYLGTDIIEGGQ
ncbi:MAG: DUF6503 family protein [Bacteroidota bacterium]